MSEKKEVKAATKTAPVKKSKVDQATKIKRNADGTKKMAVARGTERARRRLDLAKGWRNVANAKKMLPTKAEAAKAVAQ